MPCLLVDMGNTHLRWSDPQGLARGRVGSLATAALQEQLPSHWSGLPRPRAVWVSSVAGEGANRTLQRWVEAHWQVPVHFPRAYRRQLGVSNGYREPGQLGVDRWLALIGARALSHGPLIVVDCGTATTLDGMDERGQHLGGLILLGTGLMEESLLEQTAITRPDENGVPGLFATGTAAAIRSGALLATIGLIEKMYHVLLEQSTKEVTCFLTGGAADAVQRGLRIPLRREPNLVLQGLALVADVAP